MPDHEETLLTDLCTICHIYPPKYRCPRCSTRTCSLPCTKRHKLWSQCTGVRDPGVYLKRSELATPNAFDQDFNFITSIERTIERADADTERRGVRLRPVRQNGGGNSRGHEKGEVALGRALERAQVMVDRAPKGMARSKSNATRCLNRSKQIAWSVEWKTPEVSGMQHDCLESGKLEDLYGSFLRSKEPKTKKRKVRHDARKTGMDEEAEDGAVTSISLDEPRDKKDSSTVAQEESLPDQEPPPNRPSPPSTHQSAQKFYLHRPHTPSSQPTVLIPLSASETLTSALQGKVVLELPTIYVFTDGAEELPAGYVTEEAYLAGQKEENIVLRRDVVRETGEEEGLEEGELEEVSLKDIDEKKVLEVLRKDIGIDVV